MATEIILPKFGFTLEESQLVAWLVQEGDTVETGDPIAEVTTDKVNMEVEATADGILAGLRYQEGDMVPVTAVIATILAPGEKLPETAVAPTAKVAAPITPVAARIAEAEGIDVSQIQGSGPGGRITRKDVETKPQAVPVAATPAPAVSNGSGKVQATPAARRLAAENELSLQTVLGSGPNGRIQQKDVEQAIANRATIAPQAAVPATKLPEPETAAFTRHTFSNMRRTIAHNMQQSKLNAPHVPFQIDVEMTAVLGLTDQANALMHKGEKVVTVTAVLAKMVAWALLRHPLLNSHIGDGEWLQFHEVNLGIAVALPEGLIVPVVQQANRKGIEALSAEIRDVAKRARENKLRPGDMQNGTFTISNLGMFGVDRFAAIINPPQVAILAVGQTSRRFVPDANDQPVLRPICTFTLSVDHRLVDGAVAAQFLADLRRVVEQPALLSL
ncbi:MAG: 2-oxo acid dehydrogenase subunit E2 [Anaerolineales bacterium]|nr:2-oxo acid dehydrogenase subunit E2 [Anaerolineales bacterium]